MNLSLTPAFEQFIQQKIDSGMYTNASEVVRDALRRMDEQNIWKELYNFITPRLTAAKNGEVVSQSFASIIDEVQNP